MKSLKCSKAEVDWALANVLRNAPAKIQRKKINDAGEKKMTKKAKLEAFATIEKT